MWPDSLLPESYGIVEPSFCTGSDSGTEAVTEVTVAMELTAGSRETGLAVRLRERDSLGAAINLSLLESPNDFA